MADDSPYGSRFFAGQGGRSSRSAEIVAPILLELFPSRSVVDVGCGVGGWLDAFGRLGVERLLGVDGDYVDRAQLRIDPALFTAADLTQPFRAGRFDLALSLEVAEHLAEDHAETFVDTLTGLSDRVVFSAAIPGQGGTHHVNERWPEYWRGLFARRGYRVFDCIRPRIWSLDGVNGVYRQNLLAFVKDGTPFDPPPVAPPLDVVHPMVWDALVQKTQRSRNRPVRRFLRERMREPLRALRARLGLRKE